MKKVIWIVFVALCSCTLIYAAAYATGVVVGDRTTHGGIVTGGSSDVFFEAKPAARVGDYATCPIVEFIPHVGGQIVTGSGSVLINGTPAAKTGSVVIENGSTSTLVGSATTVIVGD